MSKKFFNAVKKAKCIGDGTVGDLVSWLEAFVNVVFPENGIEYWADNRFANGKGLKRFQSVPTDGGNKEDVHHVACYVRHGSNEGYVIEVGLYLRDDTLKSLSWIKTFGNDDECWQIARAIDAALTSIIFYGEVPELVEMAGKLPRAGSWYRETTLCEEVSVAATPQSIMVTTPSGLILDNRDWSDMGSNAKFFIDPRVKDWEIVLSNMKARFKVTKENRLVVDDLPGYIISDRGIEGCNGYYVLKPNGNPLDDRDYIGYFFMEGKAIEAAQLHRDGKHLELAKLIERLQGSKAVEALVLPE